MNIHKEDTQSNSSNDGVARIFDDHFASMVGVFRSSTVFDYKERAKAECTQRQLRGNKFMFSGKIGERIVKKTGLIESKMKRVKDVRGCHYTKLVINQTIQRN